VYNNEPSAWGCGRRASIAAGCDHANTRTCSAFIAANVPTEGTTLYTDEGQSDRGSHPSQATVRHGVGEWARDDDGDSRREGHCDICMRAGLRTYLRACRGVPKQDLHLYGATYEAIVNTKQVTPTLIRQMCIRHLSAYTGYT
jgi:hypothetical protein